MIAFKKETRKSFKPEPDQIFFKSLVLCLFFTLPSFLINIVLVSLMVMLGADEDKGASVVGGAMAAIVCSIMVFPIDSLLFTRWHCRVRPRYQLLAIWIGLGASSILMVGGQNALGLLWGFIAFVVVVHYLLRI